MGHVNNQDKQKESPEFPQVSRHLHSTQRISTSTVR